MHMPLKLDAESLRCAHGIIELGVLESKKGNQYLLLRNLVRLLNSEEAEAREDDGSIRGSGEKDSSSTLTVTSDSVQFANESTYDFVMKLMCKRKVLILPKEKDCPYDEKLTQHAISTCYFYRQMKYL